MIASGRATAHPCQDCESCYHVAQPAPTCGKRVVAELAFSSPKETEVWLNKVVFVKSDRVPEGFRPSSPYSGLLPGQEVAGLIFLVSLCSSDGTETLVLPDTISGNFSSSFMLHFFGLSHNLGLL